MKTIFETAKYVITVEPKSEKLNNRAIILPMLGYIKSTMRDNSKDVEIVLGWVLWMATITINVLTKEQPKADHQPVIRNWSE